jgi:hypothetical protein
MILELGLEKLDFLAFCTEGGGIFKLALIC